MAKWLPMLWRVRIGISVLSTLGCGPDYAYRLSGGYQLARTSAHQVKVVPIGVSDPDVTPTLPAKVVEIAWDDRFIITKQQHLTAAYGQPVVPPRFSYWILDVRTPKRYGPFDLKTFGNKRAELGVQGTLQLRSVRSYR